MKDYGFMQAFPLLQPMDYGLEICMVESIEFIYLILLKFALETIAEDGKYV